MICHLLSLCSGEEHRLKFVENFPTTFFSDVLTELVARPDCHQKHLDYTVCKLWSLHKFSAEEISLSRVLSVIGATHLPVIQRLVELGMIDMKECEQKFWYCMVGTFRGYKIKFCTMMLIKFLKVDKLHWAETHIQGGMHRINCKFMGPFFALLNWPTKNMKD